MASISRITVSARVVNSSVDCWSSVQAAACCRGSEFKKSNDEAVPEAMK